MSIGRIYFVVCDARTSPQCRNTSSLAVPAISTTDARRAARGAGWVRRREAATPGFVAEYRDLCPACAEGEEVGS